MIQVTDEQKNKTPEKIEEEIKMESAIERVRKTKEYKEQVAKGVDVEALIEAVKQTPRFKKYGKTDATEYSIYMSVVIPAYDAGEPFDEELMILSGHDRYGNDPKFPTSFVALRKNKQFCNVGIFDVNSIKVPCKCRVIGNVRSNDYGVSVTPASGGITRVESIGFDVVQAALSKVSIGVKAWDKLEDLLSDGKKQATVCFRAPIGGAKTIDIWLKNEQTGKNEISGFYRVLTGDQRNPEQMHPTLQMGLDYPGGYDVYANLIRQRYGSPIYRIEDFDEICADANELATKEEQSSFVRDLIVGREVFAIVDVWQNKPGRDGKRYITGNAAFIMEVIPEPTQSTIGEDTPPKPARTTTSTENPYVEPLVNACMTMDKDPQWVPVEKCRKIAEIPDEVTDQMVHEISKRASQIWTLRKKNE
jgi:hypothetical protein